MSTALSQILVCRGQGGGEVAHPKAKTRLHTLKPSPAGHIHLGQGPNECVLQGPDLVLGYIDRFWAVEGGPRKTLKKETNSLFDTF